MAVILDQDQTFLSANGFVHTEKGTTTGAWWNGSIHLSFVSLDRVAPDQRVSATLYDDGAFTGTGPTIEVALQRLLVKILVTPEGAEADRAAFSAHIQGLLSSKSPSKETPEFLDGVDEMMSAWKR